MPYCRLCGINEVSGEGDICDLCALTTGESSSSYQPTAAQSAVGRRVLLDVGPGNIPSVDYTSHPSPISSNSSVAVGNTSNAVTNIYQSTSVTNSAQTGAKNVMGSHAEKEAETAVCAGIVKNIILDTEPRGFAEKVIGAIFSNIPFTHTDEVLMFQVYPDYTGSGLNSQGNACDQIRFYGKVQNGVIAENNDVEVYGFRDNTNTVISTWVKNTATGVMIFPKDVTPAATVKIMTLLVLVLMMILSFIFIHG